MDSKLFIKISIFVLLIAIFYSCSVESKFANNFVQKKNKGAVLVLSPDNVFKSNLKDSIIIKHHLLSQAQKDSLLQISNFYLKFIDERIFVDNSLSYLKDELIQMGFQVYDEKSMDQFMLTNDSSYVLKLSQVEFEEGYGDRIKTEYYYDNPIDVKARVNFVNINSWFKLERKNFPDEIFPLLYTSGSIMDGINVDFFYNEKEQFQYSYEIDTLSIKDFSGVPEILGKKYASYFYDYVMNISILENLPVDKSPTYYFHYDPIYKKVYPLMDESDHFVEIIE